MYIQQPTSIAKALTKDLDNTLDYYTIIGVIKEGYMHVGACYDRVMKYTTIMNIKGDIVLLKRTIAHYVEEYTDSEGRLIDDRFDYQTSHYIRKKLSKGVRYDGQSFQVQVDLDGSNRIKYVYPDTQTQLSKRDYNDLINHYIVEIEERLQKTGYIKKDKLDLSNEPKALEL